MRFKARTIQRNEPLEMIQTAFRIWDLSHLCPVLRVFVGFAKRSLDMIQNCGQYPNCKSE